MIDEAARQKLVAERKAEQEKTRAEFQRLDKALDNMGL